MNQIYNLAQTIASDKETIAKLEKHLLNAKSILAAHEDAMERLTTVPSVIVSDNKETPATVNSTACGGASVNRERITYNNNQELGVTEGDIIEVVINGDPDLDFKGFYKVEDMSTDRIVPFYLRDERDVYWYEFDECNDESELYLIRTPEGSLNK